MSTSVESSIRSVMKNSASVMPEFSLLLLRRPGERLQIVSLVRNSAHSNVSQMFDEEERRRPKEDTLLALDGVIGAYPNARSGHLPASPTRNPDRPRAKARHRHGAAHQR